MSLLAVIPAILAVVLTAPAGGERAPAAPAAATRSPAEFVRVQAGKLVVGPDGREIRLRGVGFSTPTIENPSDADYADIAGMNLNTVRLALSYRTFYDPETPGSFKASGWERLDANRALARRHGLYLILQLCGIEGAQFVPERDVPFDYRIWQDPALQDRFVGLWRAIAQRYRDAAEIVGYSLFCEPVVSATRAQWEALANRTIQEIRRVDPRHVLFVERIYGEHGVRRELSGKELAPDRAFFPVADSNVVYEIYFFERDEYTHQFAPWRADVQRAANYPDPAMRIVYDEGPGGLKKVFPFDRTYLAFSLDRQAEFAAKRRAPLFVWAFGAIRGCYENGRGGEGWLEDVTRLFEERGLHWTVWSYRDESFGIRDNPAARRVLSRAAGRASASVR